MMSVSSVSPAEVFQYEALPDDSDFIRLFELIDSGDDETDTIGCLLTIWPANEAPPYHAISYTWGDVTVHESIRLNGRHKAVSRNCADVLHQLKYFNTSRYYWIDAICIDQDSSAEKSLQVANMGYVFERAEHMLACLGVGNEETVYTMQVMMKAQNWVNHPSPDGKFIPEPETNSLRFILTLIQIAQNGYFQRVWVLQELLLARRVSFCLGRDILPRHLLAWHLRELKVQLMGHKHDQHYHKLAEIARWPDDIPRGIADTLNVLGSTTPIGRNLVSADGVVSLCFTRFCQDPRDTIYGTLALTAWGNKRPLVPDYTKTTYQLALECLKDYTPYGHGVKRQMLMNLKLHADHPKVKSNIELRRRRKHDLDRCAAPALYEIDARYMLIFYYAGIHMSIRHHTGSQPSPVVSRSLPSDMVTLPNSAIRPGDWVIFGDSHDTQAHTALILRQFGSVFAIVGREIAPIMDESHATTEFLVYWDPEDYLTFLLTQPSSTSVCKEPFSSFAILRWSGGIEYPLVDERGNPKPPM